MGATIQFGSRVKRPDIHVTMRASQEAIDTQLDLEKMLAAAVFEQARYFRATEPAFLKAAMDAFRSRNTNLADAADFLAHVFEHAARTAEIITATRVLGRSRVLKEVGLPFGGNEQFAEVLSGVGVTTAVEYIKSLNTVTQQEWRRLLGTAQSRAFTAAGIENRAALDSLKNLVAQSISRGWTAQKFQDEAEALLRKFQTEAGMFRTMWNTVTASAMAQGRREELNTPEVKRIVSFLLYDAILDVRVRPNHAALDGGIAPADWEGWDTYAPPNGFNCRCTLIGVTSARANALIAGKGFDLTKGVPPGAGPDPGFKAAA